MMIGGVVSGPGVGVGAGVASSTHPLVVTAAPISRTTRTLGLSASGTISTASDCFPSGGWKFHPAPDVPGHCLPAYGPSAVGPVFQVSDLSPRGFDGLAAPATSRWRLFAPSGTGTGRQVKSPCVGGLLRCLFLRLRPRLGGCRGSRLGRALEPVKASAASEGALHLR